MPTDSSGKSATKFVCWPKSPEPRALPPWFEAAVANAFARAHHCAGARNRTARRVRRARRTALGLLLGLTALLLLAYSFQVYSLREQLAAPDHVLKEKAAQRWIVMGPAAVIWNEELKPGDLVIPPSPGIFHDRETQ